MKTTSKTKYLYKIFDLNDCEDSGLIEYEHFLFEYVDLGRPGWKVYIVFKETGEIISPLLYSSEAREYLRLNKSTILDKILEKYLLAADVESL